MYVAMALVSGAWNASSPGKFSEHGLADLDGLHLYPQFELRSTPTQPFLEPIVCRFLRHMRE